MSFLSCQYFRLKCLTCCYNLAFIVHESLNRVLPLLVAAPEIGNMIRGIGEKTDNKTSQQWHLLQLIRQRYFSSDKAGCHILINTHSSTDTIHMLQHWNKTHEMGPYPHTSLNRCNCFTHKTRLKWNTVRTPA